ncbi:MAG: hypothetical protein JWL62_1321 [Hyphomicrobiales bacterium]|nr:hypothetical protein [Hyphomicrobiales bacterium]
MVSVALLPPAVAGQNSLLKTFGIALTGAATTAGAAATGAATAANLSSSKAHDQFEKAFKSFEDDLVRANAGSAAAAWTGGKPNVDTDAIARDIIKHGRSDPRYQHWLKALHGDEQKGYEYACARNSAMNDRNTDMVNAIISLAYHASNKEICLLSEDDPDFLMHITQFARLGLTGTAEYGKNVDKIIEKGRAGLAELSRERARPARKLLNDVALGNGSDGIVDRIVLSGGFWSLGYLPMASSATDVSRYSEAVVSTARILSEGKTKIQSLLGKYGADTIERALELLGISDRQILNYAHCAALGGVGSGGLLRAPWSPQGKAAYNAMACALRMRAALVDTNGAFGSADWTLGSAHAAVTSGVKKAEVYRYPDQVAHAMIYGEASTKQWWIGISEAQSVFGGLNFNHAHWSNKRASAIELINNTVINTTTAKDSGLFVLSKDGFRRIEIALDNLMAKYNGPNKALYRRLLGEMTQNVTMATGNVAKSIEFAAGMVGAIHTWNAGVVRGLVNLQVINTQLTGC